MKFRLIDALPPTLARLAQRLVEDRRGAVTVTYALLLVTMLIALGTGMDLSDALQVKYRLDLAADASAVACGETWESYIVTGYGGTIQTAADYTALLNSANTAAQARGMAAFTSQAAELGRAPASATPTVKVYQPPPTLATTGPSVICNVTYSATSQNYLMQIAGFWGLGVSGQAQSQIDLAPFIEIFFVLDTSASMMVGSTPNDQSLIATWVYKNDQKIGNKNDPNRVICLSLGQTNGCGDNYPCAFACHEEPKGSDFTTKDMQVGLANAHNPAPTGAGATTRFDVMRLALNNDPQHQFCSAATSGNDVVCGAAATSPDCNGTSPNNAEGLFAHIRDCFPANSLDTLNTIKYALYGFNEGINGNFAPVGTGGSGIFNPVTGYPDNSQEVVLPTKDLPTIANGVNAVTIGLNTHLMPPAKQYSKTSNSVLQDLVDLFSAKGPYDKGAAGPYATAATSIPGTTADNPLKFIILLTDGMSSDRNWDWCAPWDDITLCNNDPWPSGSVTHSYNTSPICSNWVTSPQFDGTTLYQGNECRDGNYEPSWWKLGGGGWYPGSTTSTTYDSAIDTDAKPYSGNSTSFCTQLKNTGNVTVNVNGTAESYKAVTVAVLETPYVPMNGQDPAIHPFEGGVQQTIYPNGFSATSALSSALQACATQSSSQNYYFQANSDSSIASGFITLFDSFVGQYVHLTQ